jgi:hypothetical protein
LQGTLGACPHHPELMHDFEISDIEEIWKNLLLVLKKSVTLRIWKRLPPRA